jgi:hypothetical protein
MKRIPKRSRTKTARKAVAAVAAVVALELVGIPGLQDPEPASANYFGTGSGGCCLFADNSSHTFNYASMVSYNRSSMYDRRLYMNDWTALSTSYDSSPDSQTDVVGYDEYYTTYWGLDWDGSETGFNIYGYSKCVSTSGTSAGRCQRNEVRFDLADTDGWSDSNRRKLACHEMGHTVGLDHTDYDSCLRSNSTTAPTEGYSDHDKSHMDSKY